MKFFLPIISCVILVFILIFSNSGSTNADYLRIHIRANSNLSIDQNIKYAIKDAVVENMVPLIANCETKAECMIVIKNNLLNIETIANYILYNNNYNYTCNAKLCEENFPTRNYGDLTLESGFYDALILELGSACGDNWWCVVYPPLCFINGNSTSTAIKSRLLEIIKKFGINL